MTVVFGTFLFCSLFHLAESQEDSTDQIISTLTGDVSGFKDKTPSGNIFYKFLGIPYDEPPVENLRFKDPMVKKSWSGTLNATEFYEQCVQKSFNPGFPSTVLRWISTKGHTF